MPLKPGLFPTWPFSEKFANPYLRWLNLNFMSVAFIYILPQTCLTMGCGPTPAGTIHTQRMTFLISENPVACLAMGFQREQVGATVTHTSCFLWASAALKQQACSDSILMRLFCVRHVMTHLSSESTEAGEVRAPGSRLW